MKTASVYIFVVFTGVLSSLLHCTVLHVQCLFIPCCVAFIIHTDNVFHRSSLKLSELFWGSCFPSCSVDSESAYNAEDLGSISGLERSPGEGKGCPL